MIMALVVFLRHSTKLITIDTNIDIAVHTAIRVTPMKSESAIKTLKVFVRLVCDAQWMLMNIVRPLYRIPRLTTTHPEYK